MGQKHNSLSVPSNDIQYSSGFSMNLGSDVHKIIVNEKTIVVAGKLSMKIFRPHYVKKRGELLYEFNYVQELVKHLNENEDSKTLNEAEEYFSEQAVPEQGDSLTIRIEVKKMSDDVVHVRYMYLSSGVTMKSQYPYVQPMLSILSLFVSISKKKVLYELFHRSGTVDDWTALTQNFEGIHPLNEGFFGVLVGQQMDTATTDPNDDSLCKKIQIFPLDEKTVGGGECCIEREFSALEEGKSFLRWGSSSSMVFFVRHSLDGVLLADVYDFSKENFVAGLDCLLRAESINKICLPCIIGEDSLVVLTPKEDFSDGWKRQVFRFSDGEMLCEMEKTIPSCNTKRTLDVRYVGFSKATFAELERNQRVRVRIGELFRLSFFKVTIINRDTGMEKEVEKEFLSPHLCLLDRGNVLVGFAVKYLPLYKKKVCVILAVNLTTGKKTRLGRWWCSTDLGVLGFLLPGYHVQSARRSYYGDLSPFKVLNEESFLFFNTKNQTISRLDINGNSTLIVKSTTANRCDKFKPLVLTHQKYFSPVPTLLNVMKGPIKKFGQTRKFEVHAIGRNMVVIKNGDSAIVVEHSFFYSFRTYIMMVWSKLGLPMDVLRYVILEYFNESWCDSPDWRRRTWEKFYVV